EDYGGHGIGTQKHIEPPGPHQGRPRRGPGPGGGVGPALPAPLGLGGPRPRPRRDGGARGGGGGGPAGPLAARGGRHAAGAHARAITADGPSVLTAADGGREGFARLAQWPPRELARSNS